MEYVSPTLNTQNCFGKTGLKRAITHALAHERIVGGWLNDQDELFYFDSVKVFKNNVLKEAIEFAKQNRQLVIFNLTNFREIRIP